MIRKENLEDVLKAIGYIRDAHKKIYEKHYAAFDCVIEVDFTGSGSIRYPEDKGFRADQEYYLSNSGTQKMKTADGVTIRYSIGFAFKRRLSLCLYG